MSNRRHIEILVNPVEDLPSMFGLNAHKEISKILNKQMRDRWNRCDCCGRFISFAAFGNGTASRVLLTPDSHFTRETYETLCEKHSK